jgi:hypothetical protein
MRPRVAHFTDAGPGVGVSNLAVKFRDADLAGWNVQTTEFVYTELVQTAGRMKPKEPTQHLVNLKTF